MTKPLVSLLLPTRKRVPQLRRCLESIFDHCTEPDAVETLVKIDIDDEDSKAIVDELVSMYGAKVRITPRERGYDSLDKWLYEMENDAEGQWCWALNDDMTVERGDWLAELRKVPLTGYIVHPEQSKLGYSTYFKAEAQAFPIYPKHCWKPDNERLATPTDMALHTLMVKKRGWKTWFLTGCVFWHQRQEHLIHDHRQL